MVLLYEEIKLKLCPTQMCINIANEQLQHFFNEYIFKWEQEECAREGVDVESISYQSNWPVVELFLEKTAGLLALIDEESRFPRATNRSLAAKMHKVHHRGQEVSSDDVHRVYRAPPDRGTKFMVNHYAGYVSQVKFSSARLFYQVCTL